MIDITNEREFNALVGLIEKGLVEGNAIETLHELRRAALEIDRLRAEVARLAAEIEARPAITREDAAAFLRDSRENVSPNDPAFEAMRTRSLHVVEALRAHAKGER